MKRLTVVLAGPTAAGRLTRDAIQSVRSLVNSPKGLSGPLTYADIIARKGSGSSIAAPILSGKGSQLKEFEEPTLPEHLRRIFDGMAAHARANADSKTIDSCLAAVSKEVRTARAQVSNWGSNLVGVVRGLNGRDQVGLVLGLEEFACMALCLARDNNDIAAKVKGTPFTDETRALVATFDGDAVAKIDFRQPPPPVQVANRGWGW